MNRSINPELLCSGRSCSVGKFVNSTPQCPPKAGTGTWLCGTTLCKILIHTMVAVRLSITWNKWFRDGCVWSNPTSWPSYSSHPTPNSVYSNNTQMVDRFHANVDPKSWIISRFIFLIYWDWLKKTGEITISIKCHEKRRACSFTFLGPSAKLPLIISCLHERDFQRPKRTRCYTVSYKGYMGRIC